MPKKILVVDDEPDVVTYLTTLLEDAGYETISARDGEEGMEAVRSAPPDLITLDITMPEKSGVRMFTELKQDEALRTIPVIVVTGIQGEIEKFLSTRRQIPPPEDFIPKPVDREAFLAKIRKLIG
jgi:CheY-like chemotaxis protein